MAWTNRWTRVSTGGNLVEFFSALKTAILDNTDWTLVEDECDNLLLVFQTGLPELKMVIRNYSYSHADDSHVSATFSMVISFINSCHDTDLGGFTLPYTGSSNTSWKSECTRQANIRTFGNGTTEYLCINDYSNTGDSADFYFYGKFNTTTISDGTQHTRYLLNNTFYDKDWLTGKEISQPNMYTMPIMSGSCDGVTMINYLLRTLANDSGVITEYCNDVYNCSNMAISTKYNINSENYTAINSSTLFKMQEVLL